MKVIYEETILDKIDNEISNAKKIGKKVREIELSNTEFEELNDLLHLGRHRYLCNKFIYHSNVWYDYHGVKLRTKYE